MKFNLPTYTTNYFSTKVWVQCPKCAEKALVIAEPSEYIIPLNNEAKMQCTSCSFKAETNDVWNGYCQGFINQSCGFCGSEITHNTKPTKELYKNKNIKCNTCKKEKEYELLWALYRSYTPTDPYFGYSLWLQTTVKNKVLWGYNKKHLDYIKSYIKATLREDTSRNKYSLIANLPQWMIVAKNRETIVKKIDKLITLL